MSKANPAKLEDFDDDKILEVVQFGYKCIGYTWGGAFDNYWLNVYEDDGRMVKDAALERIHKWTARAVKIATDRGLLLKPQANPVQLPSSP